MELLSSQLSGVAVCAGEADPCADAECDVNADCIAHETTYQCVCKPGYEGTGRRCQGLFCSTSILYDCVENILCFWPTGRSSFWHDVSSVVVCLSSVTHVLWLNGIGFTGKLITQLISPV